MREEERRREAAAARVLAAARAEAARRTGWQPVMTEMAGYAALGEDWAARAEELDDLDERRCRCRACGGQGYRSREEARRMAGLHRGDRMEARAYGGRWYLMPEPGAGTVPWRERR